jgi:predicted nucleotidyltransferase
MTRDSILSFLKQHKQLLVDQYHVKTIGLFGSYATEHQTDKSDIDILVDMPSSFDLYYDLKEFLETSFKNSVDLGLTHNVRSFIKEKIDKEIIYV